MNGRIRTTAISLFLVMMLSGGNALAQPVAVVHPAGQFADLGGVRIWWEAEGAGEPLVLIAGGPGLSHAYFHPFFSSLSDAYRVIYVDAYGTGKSDRAASATEYSLSRDIETLEALRRHLKLGAMHVLGHSYGGFVAQGFAAKYPASVKSLILVATVPTGKDFKTVLHLHNRDVSLQFPETWETVMKLRREGNIASSPELQEAFSVPGFHNFYNPENRFKLAVTDPGFYNPDHWYAMGGKDADFNLKGELARFDYRAALKKLPAPILVIGGRLDRNIFPSVVVQYKSLLPKASFVMMERIGHFPFVEETEEMTKVLRGFLSGVSLELAPR